MADAERWPRYSCGRAYVRKEHHGMSPNRIKAKINNTYLAVTEDLDGWVLGNAVRVLGLLRRWVVEEKPGSR